MVGRLVEIPQAGCECREIPGHEGYAVGRDGSVWSCWGRGKSGAVGVSVIRPYWHRLKGTINNKYRSIGLRDGSSRRVHHLVLEAFVGPRPHPKMQCRHLNGDRFDNRAENLAWGTVQQNHDDKKLHGTTARGERIFTAKLTDQSVVAIREAVASGSEYPELAKEYNVTPELIGLVAKGRIWQHVGGPITKSMRRHGERIHSAQLTEEAVVAMREEYAAGASQDELAKKYRFKRRSLGDVLLGRTWSHAGGPIAQPKDITRVAAKLNETQVSHIKRALKCGETAKSIAARYGVSPTTIGDIKNGKTWPNVPIAY